MKYLLLLIVLVIAYAAWRSGRVREMGSQGGRGAAPPPALPQDMVQCTVCSVHLPRGEAITGASGRLYCSPEHRRAGGD